MKKYLALMLSTVVLLSACNLGEKKKLKEENAAMQVEMAQKEKDLEEFGLHSMRCKKGLDKLMLQRTV